MASPKKDVYKTSNQIDSNDNVYYIRRWSRCYIRYILSVAMTSTVTLVPRRIFDTRHPIYNGVDKNKIRNQLHQTFLHS